MALPPAATAQLPPTPDLPPYSWKTLSPSAQLFYIRNFHDANSEIPHLETDVLGFDLEWKPIYRRGQSENPVALVQLANNDRILLIQISAMSEFPENLKQLLENPGVLKTGVGIQKDAEKLFRDHGVSMRGCVDLALLARTVDNVQWKGPYRQGIALARLVQAYRSLAMAKGKVQRSNWELYLSAAQQTYAANDAHAGYVLYASLEEMMGKMTIAPKTEFYAFDCIEGRLCKASGEDWFPENPHYDPGPLPPPNPPREKNGRRSRNKNARVGQSTWRGGNQPGAPPSTSSSLKGGAQTSNEDQLTRPAFRKNYRGRSYGEHTSDQTTSLRLAPHKSDRRYPRSPQPPGENNEGTEEGSKSNEVQMNHSTQQDGIQLGASPSASSFPRGNLQMTTDHRPNRPAFRKNTRGRPYTRGQSSGLTALRTPASSHPTLNQGS
ncbi:hypothetical protein AX15_005698 [Amanita polypyramis BW_CC]|nr:hypothetical protein AX15_005698 [Amanita polypyramis BW_CC]